MTGDTIEATEELPMDHVGLFITMPFWSKSWMGCDWPTTIFILLGCTNRDGDPEYTVKFAGLLTTVLTVTTTGPVATPLGAFVEMLVAFQDETVAGLPLNVTVPTVVPKFAPMIVTGVPATPDAGLRFVMLGAVDVTVKLDGPLETPETVTTTPPVVAPGGTFTVTLVAVEFVTTAPVPLNVTVLDP